MLEVTVHPDVRHVLPDAIFGVVSGQNVQIRTHDAALWTMLQELIERLRNEYGDKGAVQRPEIAATRRAYRALGDDPTHYRPANEALLRRVLGQRGFPQINTIVDINNYVSLESGFALGCYNLAHIAAPVVVRRGRVDEQYVPIGKPAVHAVNRLVLVDDNGIFGSPTADSQRTMVTQDAHDVLFVIFGFGAVQPAVQQALERSASLLEQFCGATIAASQIIRVEQAPLS